MSRWVRVRSMAVALFVLVFAASFVAAATPATRAGAATATGSSPDPFYGTWSDGLSPTPADAATELDHQAQAGVGLIRQYIFWDRIETSPGVYDWSRSDQLVTDATARGIRILPTLLYSPAFYSSKPAGSTSHAIFPPSDPQTMARFAEAMVRRYGPDGSFWCTASPVPGLPPSCRTPYLPLTAWEVWNEPDYPSWWKGSPNASEYAALLHAVSAGIRRADPSAEVVLSSLTNAGASTPGGFLDQLYGLGAAPDFDTVSVNPYAKDVAGMESYVRGTRAIADKNGDADTPIRITEYGWATGGKAGTTVTTEPCQAALVYTATRRLVALRTDLKIKSIIQFQWRDPVTTSSSWPDYAGVERADGSAKPSLGAFTEAIAARPAPAGLTVPEACPADRQNVGPDPSVVVDDSFSGTATNGWAPPETGGPFTIDRAAASSFSVAGGTGRVVVSSAGTSRSALLLSTSTTNLDVRLSVATDKAATGTAGQLVTLAGRHVGAGTEYRVRARFGPDGKVWLSVLAADGGTETRLGDEVAVAGLTRVPGVPVTVRARLTGVSPTTVDVKAWRRDDPEPSAWTLTRTDSDAALQASGSIGVQMSLSPSSVLDAPVTFTVDDLHATAPK